MRLESITIKTTKKNELNGFTINPDMVLLLNPFYYNLCYLLDFDIKPKKKIC